MTEQPDTAAAILSAMKTTTMAQGECGVRFDAAGSLPAAFEVTDFAAASIAMAGIGVSELLTARDGRNRNVTVDRRLSSFWFASSLRPEGWTPPSPWDSIAGDYRARDGWIRLHTNAPHHRRAALLALDVTEDKAMVTAAVLERNAEELETAIVSLGGCAAAMRSQSAWEASEAGRAVSTQPLMEWAGVGDASPRLELPHSQERPLAGLKVLDLTRVLAGPVATRFLACLGAEVLRIDPPQWDEPGVLPEVMLGKRTARLDLRSAEDRRLFEALLAASDVLVHGYRPGALDDLGFDLAARRRIRPGLIDVSLDAYGWAGPWSNRRGFDSLVQMSCGIAEAGMRHFGADRPKPLPVQALDHATGYLMAYAAIQAITLSIVEKQASSVCLSLAKTAEILMRFSQHDCVEMAPETSADIFSAVENTGWGPARRLKPPLNIEGVTFGSDRPSMPLGTHSPSY